MVVPSLIVGGMIMPMSTATAPSYIPPGDAQRLQFLHIFATTFLRSVFF